MKHLKALREQRAKAVEDMNAIKAACEKESRSRTAEEKTKWAELTQKIKDLDDEIKDFEAQEAEEARSAKPVSRKDDEGNDDPEKRDKKDYMSLRGQVESWQKRNADAIEKIKAGQWTPLTSFELRAADSPMTPTTIKAGSTITMGAPELIREGSQIVDILRVQPTLWDLLPKGRTNKETYTWVNKKVPAGSGAADFLAPGSAKPPVSFTLTVEKSNAKKVAVTMKVATELLDDVDGMTSLIQTELWYQLRSHVNSILMGNAAASATDPAGIRSFANAYTLAGVQTQNPNNLDCVLAAIAQVRAGFIDGPVLVVMHPVDVVNMKITKAVSQGQYMGLNLIPIPGGFIVEDYNITQGDIMVIALDALKTLIYKDFKFDFGYNNDDFEKNLLTFRGEMRIHSFHSDNHAAGFVYDQLADIKASIAIP